MRLSTRPNIDFTLKCLLASSAYGILFALFALLISESTLRRKVDADLLSLGAIIALWIGCAIAARSATSKLRVLLLSYSAVIGLFFGAGIVAACKNGTSAFEWKALALVAIIAPIILAITLLPIRSFLPPKDAPVA